MGTFSFPERVTGAIGVAPVEEGLDVSLVCVENCLGENRDRDPLQLPGEMWQWHGAG